MIAAIYILILAAMVILYLGFTKEDSTTLIFGSLVLTLAGLDMTINGFQDLAQPYAQWSGILLLFFALYIMIRTGIELITNRGE